MPAATTTSHRPEAAACRRWLSTSPSRFPWPARAEVIPASVRSHVRRVYVNLRLELSINDGHVGDAAMKVLVDHTTRYNTSLTTLELAGNDISDVRTVRSIAAMLKTPSIRISYLNLDNNNIDDAGAKLLASALETNRTVTTLRVADNAFTATATTLFADVIIHHNKVLTDLYLGPAALPVQVLMGVGDAAVVQEPRLLSLAHHHFSTLDVVFVSESLRLDIQSLTALDLSACDIGPEECEYIADCLRDNHSLTALNLADNSVGAIGAMFLSRGLRKCDSLRVLRLDTYEMPVRDLYGFSGVAEVKLRGFMPAPRLGMLDMTFLSDCLRHNTAVTMLDLRFHDCGNDLMDACEWLLLAVADDEKETGAGSGAGAAGAPVSAAWAAAEHAMDKAEAPKRKPRAQPPGFKISELRLRAMHITHASAASFGRGMAANTRLHTLDLSDNPGLGSPGARLIAEAIDEHPVLAVLTLISCGIGADGGAALGHALESNTALTAIDLSDNQLGDDGALKLVKHLKRRNVTLTELNIANNDVGAAGAASLGEALERNKHITKLGVRGNPIGDDGAVELCDGLVPNIALCLLDLQYCGITMRGARALEALLQKNFVLRDVALRGNKVAPKIAYSIRERVDKNRHMSSTYDRHRVWESSVRYYDNGDRLEVANGQLDKFVATGTYVYGRRGDRNGARGLPWWEACASLALTIMVVVLGLVVPAAIGEVVFATGLNDRSLFVWSSALGVAVYALTTLWARDTHLLPWPIVKVAWALLVHRRVHGVVIDVRVKDPHYNGASFPVGLDAVYRRALAASLRLALPVAVLLTRVAISWKQTYVLTAATGWCIVTFAVTMALADFRALLETSWREVVRARIYPHPPCHKGMLPVFFVFRAAELFARSLILALAGEAYGWTTWFVMMHSAYYMWLWWGKEGDRWTKLPPRPWRWEEDPYRDFVVDDEDDLEEYKRIAELKKVEAKKQRKIYLKILFGFWRQVGHVAMSAVVWPGGFRGQRVCAELDQRRADNRMPVDYYMKHRVGEDVALMMLVMFARPQFHTMATHCAGAAMLGHWVVFYLLERFAFTLASRRREFFALYEAPVDNDLPVTKAGLTAGHDRRGKRRDKRLQRKRERSTRVLQTLTKLKVTPASGGSDEVKPSADADGAGADGAVSSVAVGVGAEAGSDGPESPRTARVRFNDDHAWDASAWPGVGRRSDGVDDGDSESDSDGGGRGDGQRRGPPGDYADGPHDGPREDDPVPDDALPVFPPDDRGTEEVLASQLEEWHGGSGGGATGAT